ncbi:hypothetical protein ASG22_11260 [Chryseobacterium sp. Leaf405]|uniref:hypothetical protein n=1 Tax=Chryseobacterium sp. Leaf405 TaxID=1736367 RepID=UPI00070037E5|nr:hypothetical protein [Chryseobacterium sp. Leaf405]KQT24567.1 hypothetical protein ASG22_11260 [Chryseobacterium sp. Leaf405]
MKKWVKKIVIGLGVLLVIILLANFGLNVWLKTQLPKYIKNNTDYKVSYKNMEVDLMSGNILSTGITVNNKNPQNVDVIGLQGTIDTLKISRFGIYDAIFNKQISSSDLLLSKPNLNIILAKPVDVKTDKKRNPVRFENIRINKGNISIFKYTKQKFFSVEELNLYVENLQLTEESIEDKLPVVFDTYDVKGKNFFIQPDNVYALKINSVKTSNGRVSIENFQVIPLITIDQFKKYYPKKTKLFQVNIQKMEFTDVVLKKNKVSLANANFYNPNIVVYNTGAMAVKSDKPMNYEVDLGGFKLSNAKVQVVKPNGADLFTGENLNLNINELHFDKETSKEKIPVKYKDFAFSGKNVLFSNGNNYLVKNISLNPKKGEINDVSIVPDNVHSDAAKIKMVIDRIGFNINTMNFDNDKLNLNIKDFLVENAKGTITSNNSKIEKKNKPSGIESVLIRKISLKNSDITYDKGNQPLVFNDLNATIDNVKLTPKSDNSGLAVDVKDYLVTSKNFAYKTEFYNMTGGLLKLSKNKLQMSQFVTKPLVSRAQFIKMIPVERDLYDIKVSQITADGTWDFFSQNKYINASNVTVQSADANIFRSKIPNDDPKEKLLYSAMLRTIKIPLNINNLNVKNSILVYEEDTPESAGPGKLIFNNFNMNVKNLNSAKAKGKPTRVDIKINCSFMNLAPLSVNWNFDVADRRDVFNISGKAVNLPAVGINPFIRPYLHVTATGTIQEMLFNFRGDPKGLNGSFNLRHKDLKIAILDKDNKEKKGFLTAIANLVVKSDSGKLPEDVQVEDVERDPTKSFFNLFWKGIEQGLKRTLIGINIEKAKKTVDNTKEKVQEVKKDVKGMKQSVKEIGQEIKKNSNEKKQEQPAEEKPKKGFLKGIFNKKEKSETK